MNNGDKVEILKAIEELKIEVAILKTKQEGVENYMYKELKPDMAQLCKKMESRFRWTMLALVSFMSANIILIATAI